jgi:hypothetical protein
MTDEDPRSLKAGGETPAELVRALRALGQTDRDPARLARVAQRLGERIAASSGSPGASWLRKLTGSKLGLTGLALGFGVLGVLGYSLTGERHVPPAPATPAAPITTTPAAARRLPIAATPQEPAPQAPVQAARQQPPIAARLAQPPQAAHSPVRAARIATRSRAQSASAEPARAAEASTTGARVAPTAAPVQPAAASKAIEPVPARPQSTASNVTPKAERSEVALLHEARRLSSRQPTAALELLHEHSERFPNGLLTPEREVLSIEVLRRLGRTAEAAQRLQQFEARYPKSIHLPRLHGSSGSDL